MHSSGGGHLEVTVVSPARPIFKGDAEWVTAPALDGQLGIFPRHARLVAAMGSGLLRIGQGGGSVTRWAVRGGFLEVGNDVVTILVDSAVAEPEADAAKAKADLEKTKDELKSPDSDAEFEELLEQRGWDESRIKLAQR